MPLPKRIFSQSLLLALLAVLLMAGGSAVFYFREAGHAAKNLKEQEAARLAMFIRIIGRDIHAVVTQLRVLADGDSLRAYLGSGGQEDLDLAVQRAVFLSRQDPDLDQIRYLDEQGREVLRVNQGEGLVSAGQLQDKAGRSYFEKARVLAPGKVYVSAFDLNVDNGVVEQPLKPLLRFSTPVFDAGKRWRGVYVISYSGANLFARLQQYEPQFQHRLRVLNAGGYWLKAADPAQEWGFMFPERAAAALARTDSNLWSQVVREAEGRAHHAGALLSWHRLTLNELLAGGPDRLVMEDQFLVMASEISSGEWAAVFASLRQRFLLGGSMVLALTFACLWFLHTRRRTQEELDRFFSLSLDCLCISGADGYFRRISPAVTDVLGWSEEEFLERPYLDLVHPDDRKATQQEIKRQADLGGKVFQLENRCRHKNGSWRILSWHSVPQPGGLMYATARDVTENRRAEVALRDSKEQLEVRVQERTAELAQANEMMFRSERRFRALIEHGSDSIALFDENHLILYLSPAVTAVEGYAPEELVGRSGAEHAHPGDLPLLREIFQQLTAHPGRPIPLLWRRRHKNGQWLWLEGVATNLLHDPAVRAIVTNYRDVTERRRSEARLRRLVDSNVQGVLFWNIKGEITEANDAFLHMVDYTREDLLAGLVGWAAMTPLEYADMDRQALEEIAASGICRPYEKEYIRKDGLRVPVLVGAAGFEKHSEDHWVEGVCFVIDLTQRKRAEQALRESEGHLRFRSNLAEAMRPLAGPAQIMAVTARMLGEHLRASRCAYADVEEDGEQFVILNDYTDGCASTVGRGRLSLFGARAAATLQGGQTLILRDARNELSPDEGAGMFGDLGIQALITCPLVKDGVLRAMMAVHQAAPREWKPDEIAIVQDVVERCWATIERRNAEESIRQMNVELERRVTQRTAQLESTNKELEAFSYSISHDLRAPLRHVNGYVEMLVAQAGDTLSEKSRRYLKVIADSAAQMGQLIDDLLAFSRMGRAEMQRASVNLALLVEELVAGIQSETAARKITWKHGGLPMVEGDPSMLRQVFVNLLSNAVKYTGRRDEAVIEIGCASETADEVVVFIRDNGAGFEMKYVHKLFGVFQRLHRADEFEGTGVGLANVRRIITRHGGRVWAEGAVDAGATFYFTLTKLKKG